MFLGSFYSLISAVLSGVTPNLLRGVTRRVSPFVVNSTRVLWAVVMFTFIFLIRGELGNVFDVPINSLLLSILIAFTGPFLAWSSYMKAISKSDVSLVHPIMATYPAYAIILDYVLFSIKPSPVSFIGYMLILISITVISTEKKEGKGEKRGIIYAIFTSILWGINSILFKVILRDISAFHLSYLRVLFALPFILPFLIRKFTINKRDVLFIISASLMGDILVIFFYFSAITLAPLFIVVPISSSSPVFSALFASIFHKEKITLRRIIGILSAISGTTILILISL